MRLIDADDLLTAFPIDDEPMITKSSVRMTIQRMPTIEPEWIPVSERLPETIGEYLITALSRPNRNAIASAGYWNERLKEFGTFRQDGTWEKWDVIAWMPLPEPYKGGEDE